MFRKMWQILSEKMQYINLKKNFEWGMSYRISWTFNYFGQILKLVKQHCVFIFLSVIRRIEMFFRVRNFHLKKSFDMNRLSPCKVLSLKIFTSWKQKYQKTKKIWYKKQNFVLCVLFIFFFSTHFIIFAHSIRNSLDMFLFVFLFHFFVRFWLIRL